MTTPDSAPRCPHPEGQREPTIANPENPKLAYCYGCMSVVKLDGDEWVSLFSGVKKVRTR